MRALLIAILCTLCSQPALASTVITDWGTVLGTSHETYVLAGDLVEPAPSQGTDDAAITIAPGVRDITIDGAGFLIDGVDTGGVADFDTGIALLGLADSVIADVRIHNLRITDIGNGVSGANHLCNILVENCEFYGGVHSGAIEFVTLDLSPAFPPGPVARITIRDNWIHDSQGIPIKLMNFAGAGAAASETMTGLHVVGNVIHGNNQSTTAPEAWNAAILLRHGATGVRVWDNVVVMNDGLAGIFLGSNNVVDDVYDDVSIRGNHCGGQSGNIRSPGSVTASGITLNEITTTSGDFSTWTVTANDLYQNELFGIDFLVGTNSPASLPADGNWWGEDGAITGTYGNGAANVTDAAPLDLADGIIARPDHATTDRALSDLDGYLAQVVLLNQNQGAPGVRGFDIDYDFASFLSFERAFEGSFLERQSFGPVTAFFDTVRTGGAGNERTATCVILGGALGGEGNGALFVAVFRAAAADLSLADDFDLDGAELRDPANLPVTVLATDGADRLVDDTDPVIALGPPSTGICVNTATIDITLSVTDDVALEDVLYRFHKVGLNPACWTTLAGDEAGTGYTGPSPFTVTFADGEGDYTVQIQATDDAGNLAYDSIPLITYDTTSPADFAGTTAAAAVPGPTTPAAEEVEITWSGSYEPGADLRLRYLPYGGSNGYYAHPEYGTDTGTPLPHFPGSGEGIEVDLPDTASGSVTLSYLIAERSYYYYTLFVVDCAGNYSDGTAPDAQANALSYYLGDWDASAPPTCAASPTLDSGNGEVDFCDLIGMSLTFGMTGGDPDYDAHADIGPTTPGPGVLDLPLTDDIIDFEDLMLFAINFGNVASRTGDVVLADGSPPGTIGVELGKATTDGETIRVPLLLVGNVRQVKGIEAIVEFSGLDYLGTRPGSALGNEVFLHDLPAADRVSVNAVVLGVDQLFVGAGVIAWLEFGQGEETGRLALAGLKLRDARNEEIAGMTPTGIGAGAPAPLPGRVGLLPAEPNPFNPSTALTFVLATREHVQLRIYDLQGRLARTLADGTFDAGEHRIVWDGRTATGEELVSGVYLAEFITRANRHVQKLVLLR